MCIRDSCKALAELFDWSYEETTVKTTDAFFNLFTKAKRPHAFLETEEKH